MALEDKPATDLVQTVPFFLTLASADGTKAKTDVVSFNPLPKDDVPLTITLGSLRGLCKLSSKYYFCFYDDTNEIPETNPLSTYIISIKKNVIALRDADAAKMVATVTVYYRLRAVIDSWTRLVGDGQTSSTQPSEMTGHEWNVVFLNNSLLHGLTFDPESKAFKPAREPAFKLAKSYGDRYDFSAGYSTRIQALGREVSGNLVGLPAPDFRVVDDSSVTITSLRNSVHKSMMEQGFSSWSVEASASGGFGGFSGGVHASGGQSSEDISKAAQTQDVDLMHASYNFPRVEVILDAIDLELSDSCKEFCKGQPVDAVGFYKKFGTIFCSSVKLGARLHSSAESSTFMKVTDQTKKEEKKASFSLSFSSPFASAEAGGSVAISSQKTQTETTTNYSKNLSWEARGGETFMATEPNAWINTVGFYQNWRVVDRNGVLNILDLALPMVNGAQAFIAKYGESTWNIADPEASMENLSFASVGKDKITISKDTPQNFLGVVNAVPGSGLKFSSTAQEWEVRLSSNPSSFFFCIADADNSMTLALDYPSYRGDFAVNPLDPKNPNQVWKLVRNSK